MGAEVLGFAQAVFASLSGGVVSALLDWSDFKTVVRKVVVSSLTGFFLAPFANPYLAGFHLQPIEQRMAAYFLTALLGVLIVETIWKLAKARADGADHENPAS